jgi:hypothetical protein
MTLFLLMVSPVGKANGVIFAQAIHNRFASLDVDDAPMAGILRVWLGFPKNH